MRQRLMFLFVVLAVVGGAAALFWPTPRRDAIAQVKKLNGTYTEEPDEDGRTLTIVGFVNQPVTDDDLAMLQNIRPLHRVLLDGSKVTDAGLLHLQGIEGLEWVSTCNTAVTDAGMAHLGQIKTLRSIQVRKTRVSDVGVGHLHGMPVLEFVNLAESRVTDAGEAELRRTTPSLRRVHRVTPDED